MTTESEVPQWLKELPKTDLHCHLGGSLRVRTILELGEQHGIRMPASDEKELSALLSPPREPKLYGGPGTGKSTTAASTFALLKQRGVNAELATEYAKYVVWEGRDYLLSDQIYLFAK